MVSNQAQALLDFDRMSLKTEFVSNRNMQPAPTDALKSKPSVGQQRPGDKSMAVL